MSWIGRQFVRQSRRVRFMGGCGFELAGIIDQPEPSPAGHVMPVVVFSHCFTCNKDLKAIARIARGLPEFGIAVLRFDMTGLGNSDGEFSETNFSTNQADLVSAIRFARDALGSVDALIGHSFGGAASLAVAASDPDIAAVVSIAAPSDTVHLASLLTRMNPEIQSRGRGDVVIGGKNFSITSAMLDDFRRHALPDQIAKIRVPVMAFHAPSDTTVLYDHALRIASLVRSADDQPACTLVTLSGADHLLTSDPADVTLVTEVTASFVLRYRRRAAT